MTRVDPSTPAWVLDAAQDAIRATDRVLNEAMTGQGEDVVDYSLWCHRRSQMRSLIQRELERQRA